jgi:protein disulfide isomerase
MAFPVTLVGAVAFAWTCESSVATARLTFCLLLQVEPRHATSGNPALAALQEFVGVEEFPEVVEFTTAHARVVLGAWHNRTAWLFAPVDSAIATSFRALAAQHRSDALFIVVENDDNLKKIVGLADLPAPAFGLTRRKPSSPSKLWVYPLEAELVEGGGGAAIAAHFAAVMGGLAPKLKSAEPPADNTAPVKVVVGSTFDSFRSKDLFLKVYAPWCGHCKKMAPIWTELATAYAGDDTLTIGKMDGTDNEADSVEVKGYPTLLFFPSGRADFVPYNGKRNVEAFTEFIESVRAKQADGGGGAQESNEPVA